MGRDDHPRLRQRRRFERRQGRRAGYDRILIVCEGSKTEPSYFGEIRIAYRLPTTNITVLPAGAGTAPIQVVQYAQELFERGDLGKSIRPRTFEQVFAVFDRDDHKSYADALKKAAALDRGLKNDLGQPVPFEAIVSVPCFELWLLLHFEDVLAPLHRDDVTHRLRKHLPEYAKSAKRTFADTRGHLDTAMRRAQTLASRFQADTQKEQTPYTTVFKLVHLLTTLREE